MTRARPGKELDMTARGACSTLLAALLAAPLTAAAAPPALRVVQTCDTAAASIPGTATITVALSAGTDGSGQPNAVSALDFKLTFGASTFTVTGVRLPPALEASGSWIAPDWEGSLFPGQPLPAGSVQVALAPRLAVPLPVLPDGPVVEIDVAVEGSAAPACSVFAFPPEGVVFSAPPLGVAIAGSAQDGGVDVGGEVCDDCTDNNGNGATDMADARCTATGLTLKAAKTGKTSTKPMRLTAELAGLVSSVGGGGLRLTVGAEGGTALCELLPPERFTTKKNGTLMVKNAGKITKLVLKPQKKRGVTRVTAVLSGVALPAGAQELGVSVQASAQRFYGTGTLRTKKGRIVFP
jgi:hypothetical protein